MMGDGGIGFLIFFLYYYLLSFSWIVERFLVWELYLFTSKNTRTQSKETQTLVYE